MNNPKKRNGIVILLLVLVLVVWGLGLAGLVKSFVGRPPRLKKDDPGATESQHMEHTAPAESPAETSSSPKVDETAPIQTPAQPTAPQTLNVSGIWDMTFHRYYSIEDEGSWEPIGMEEIFLWMEIYPGKQFECDIMPYEGYINGESFADSLALEPQLHTGEVSGNTLRLYLDLDNFYLNPAIEVNDTIQPGYIEIPITENGLPRGTYDNTWVAVVGDYNLQSRVTIDLKKR
ncbi:MAG: hypothetical protein ACOX0U_10775 [Oscillospiraceae bacterium]|jgi:hypothetical protein